MPIDCSAAHSSAACSSASRVPKWWATSVLATPASSATAR